MTELTMPTTRVLIIEDDPNIVDLIRANLAVRGFDTLVSADGSKALSLLETEQPDMVLLDLMLPEADGFELCRQIRERSTVAIIVTSSLPWPASGFACGGKRCISPRPSSRCCASSRSTGASCFPAPTC